MAGDGFSKTAIHVATTGRRSARAWSSHTNSRQFVPDVPGRVMRTPKQAGEDADRSKLPRPVELAELAMRVARRDVRQGERFALAHEPRERPWMQPVGSPPEFDCSAILAGSVRSLVTGTVRAR